MLGGGSNVLVRDEGVPGVVVRLTGARVHEIAIDKQTVTAGGGAKLGHVDLDWRCARGWPGWKPWSAFPARSAARCTATPAAAAATSANGPARPR